MRKLFRSNIIGIPDFKPKKKVPELFRLQGNFKNQISGAKKLSEIIKLHSDECHIARRMQYIVYKMAHIYRNYQDFHTQKNMVKF